ncbi:hypothetical protein [Hansschlegelia sp.]|uniref:hypothetical protein n=1 Tax=Hansschlegelia sp. TaxID=2041892 RepID=UPI002C7FC126|nr:hypothetical protein [Hansschlegelia sp.]HVI28864.1 hypothetical protein [Hansschlegelia sp.]
MPYQQVVDGRQGAALESVDPDRGRILFLFHVASNELFVWIADMLVRHAPRLTGRYADSFRLFAGGRQIEVGEALPKADEYAFLNVQPYAGRLERGWSGQAPDGVLQAVAALAKVRYADVAQVRFTYRHFSEFGLAPKPTTRAEKASNRTPAIMVSLR